MKNEQTGGLVASIAGTMDANTKGVGAYCRLIAITPLAALPTQEFLNGLGFVARDLGTLEDLRSVLGSVLTQAPDRPKKGKVKRGR